MADYKTKYEKYRPYVKFIKKYRVVSNAATGSSVDANANVENKNVTTCTGELPKADFIGTNRLLMSDKLIELYGEDMSEEYLRQLDTHEIYKHDETQPILPYCVSITMYPFLFKGMKEIGGISGPPKNLQSFCGSFINLVFAIAAQFAGAVSTPEFLTYMDYFIRLEYGDEYYKRPQKVVDLSTKKRSVDDIITQYWQQIVYSLCQPAAARNYQCVREDTTQLWTPDGFKYLSELKEGDECYVWKDGEIKIDTINHLNVYEYDDEMIQFSGNNYQQTVTPNHRVVYKKTDGSNTYAIKEASELYNHSKLSLPICGTNNFEDYPMNDDMLRVCTYALTDGSLTKPSDDAHKHAHTTLTYYMSPNRSGYQEVITGLTNLGIGFRVAESTCNNFGKVNVVTVPPIEASSICNALENTKKRMPGFYKQLSQRQAQLVLDCWSKSDGQKLRSLKENTRLKLQCDNMEIADTLQHVCMLAGTGSTISVERTGVISDDSKTYNNTIYVNTFSRDCKRVSEYNKVHYKGRVWCPSTDTGIVIFREENNTPYISGNSVFWNLAYFDKPYFEGIFEDFVFPDGSAPCFESTMWLQKRFMKWFNQERLRRILTFPVETVNLLNQIDEKGEPYFVDDDFADFTAEMWAEGHSFFLYTSNSVDSLASCCFSKDTEVLWKTSYDGVHCTTLEELHNLKWEPYKKNLKIFHNGFWVNGKTIKLPKRAMYKVVTSNNKTIYMTDNHINMTLDGEKPTIKLTTDDYLAFNSNSLESIPENDEYLSYEQGFIVGAFLGDGSFGARIKGMIYETNFSINANKYEAVIDNLSKVVQQMQLENMPRLSKVYNNVYPLRIASKKLVSFIQKWTAWEEGTYAYNKKLNLNCLLQSKEFRQGILDGWYNTDGGNSNRCYTASSELAKDMEILITSLGLNSIVNVNDRTDEEVIIRGEEFKRNYPLYCIRWYEPCQKSKLNNVYIWKNNTQYFKITSIEKVDYDESVYCIERREPNDPYFTLPNGLITHNCRLRNELQDNTFSYTLGAGGVSTGSKCVITINFNRLVQNTFKTPKEYKTNPEKLDSVIRNQVQKIHKYLIAYNDNLKDNLNSGLMPVYDAGYISMDKQFLTIGINGLVEGAEYLGIEISPNDEYFDYCTLCLKPIYEENKNAKTEDLMFNTEYVPAENLGVKNAKWDKEAGYFSPRDCYNSYFFKPEDDTVSILDKLILHGEKTTRWLDGGSACHINLSEHLSKEQYKKLMLNAVKTGASYITFNVPNTICNDCGHISKHKFDKCPRCSSENIDWATRIIGYLKMVSKFSEQRQIEASHRYYADGSSEIQ